MRTLAFFQEHAVAEQDDAQATWLPIIGKALSYLCLQEAQRKEPGKFDSVLKRVKFLQGLGLNDAGQVAFFARLVDGTEGIYLATPVFER